MANGHPPADRGSIMVNWTDINLRDPTMQPYMIRSMTISDYDAVIDLLKQTPGVTFRDADSRDATARYLQRNPGLSFVALADGRLAGCIMSGHDGRRGYLQHLVVSTDMRRNGIARALVHHCIEALGKEGIAKSHLDVLRSNENGAAFWQHLGWTLRTDLQRFSFVASGGSNA
jgi:ribosomal protein S18 acetylase RimI-like enzyme